MTLRKLWTALAFVPLATVVAAAPAVKFTVKPNEFDPAKSNLVQAAWLKGIGCPTGATAQVFQPPDFSTTAEQTDHRPGVHDGRPGRQEDGRIAAGEDRPDGEQRCRRRRAQGPDEGTAAH
jgi:hypothetical protein